VGMCKIQLSAENGVLRQENARIKSRVAIVEWIFRIIIRRLLDRQSIVHQEVVYQFLEGKIFGISSVELGVIVPLVLRISVKTCDAICRENNLLARLTFFFKERLVSRIDDMGIQIDDLLVRIGRLTPPLCN